MVICGGDGSGVVETAAGIEITAHRVGGIIRVWCRNVIGLVTVGNMFVVD